MSYEIRVIDRVLDELMPDLPAIALEGPKGVGKTATAEQRARTVFRLDIPGDAELVSAAPAVLASAERPILIDEWQRFPLSWDLVRRAVDDDSTGGQFLLTGSSTPKSAPSHSGAGRIVSLRMRGLSIAERRIEEPTVSLRALFDGEAVVAGRTAVGVPEYVEEIIASGFPAIRPLGVRPRRAALDGYLTRMVEHEIADRGVGTRQPDQLRRWLSAYARATASTATFSTITNAAFPGDGEGISRTTVDRYRDVLTQFWLLDGLPAADLHLPGVRLGETPKHFLADPALAARLMDLDEERLLAGAVTGMLGPQDRTGLGALFEALTVMSMNVYAQAADARTSHLRTRNGDREVDLLARRYDGRIVAFEVKLTGAPDDRDVRHLLWLREKLGDRLADVAVITTGQFAYRRPDGVAVVPLALLGV